MLYWIISNLVNGLLNNIIISTAGNKGVSAESACIKNARTGDIYISGIYTRSTCFGDNCTRGTSIGGACIRSSYTANAYIEGVYFADTGTDTKNSSIKDTYTKNTYIKDTYIKDTFIQATYNGDVYTKNIYTGSINPIKHLKMYFQSFQILELKLFRTEWETKIGIDW